MGAGLCCGRCQLRIWHSKGWIVASSMVLMWLVSLHILCMLAGSFAGRSGIDEEGFSDEPMAVMLWHEQLDTYQAIMWRDHPALAEHERETPRRAPLPTPTNLPPYQTAKHPCLAPPPPPNHVTRRRPPPTGWSLKKTPNMSQVSRSNQLAAGYTLQMLGTGVTSSTHTWGGRRGGCAEGCSSCTRLMTETASGRRGAWAVLKGCHAVTWGFCSGQAGAGIG